MNNLLKNLRVLNTRPLHQAGELSEDIIKQGGIPIPCPALAIEAFASNSWVPTLPALSTFSHAIFISVNAAQSCFKSLAEHHIKWPSALQTIAIGSSTAKAIEAWNIKVDLKPIESNSEQLLALPTFNSLSEKNFILFKGKGGRPLLRESLENRGAKLLVVDVYKRILPQLDRQYLDSLWQDDTVDIILFTSQQAMHNLFTLFGKQARPWLCQKPCLVISERLAKAARLLGIKTIICSRPETMVTALQQFNKGLIHDNE